MRWLVWIFSCTRFVVIQRLLESSGGVIGFKVVGHVSVEEYESVEQQLQLLVHSRRDHPIGILVDLTAMDSVDLRARWEEIRFLQKFTVHIARIAVVGSHPWEQLKSMFVVAAALLQSETLYFHESQIQQAWQWVRTSKHAMDPPPPRIAAAEGIWKGYIPEYMDV